MKTNLYQYKAFVTKVYDGDTITVEIDLGFKTLVKGEKIRLRRINAPEVRGDQREAGLKSRDYLRVIILNKEIILETIKDKKGKYGRYLGEVFHKQKDGEWLNINNKLVEEGFAEFKEY